jgi:hypothetical protein
MNAPEAARGLRNPGRNGKRSKGFAAVMRARGRG